jgi:hypothetical protein
MTSALEVFPEITSTPAVPGIQLSFPTIQNFKGTVLRTVLLQGRWDIWQSLVLDFQRPGI